MDLGKDEEKLAVQYSAGNWGKSAQWRFMDGRNSPAQGGNMPRIQTKKECILVPPDIQPRKGGWSRGKEG